jgi:hypothetical protein
MSKVVENMEEVGKVLLKREDIFNLTHVLDFPFHLTCWPFNLFFSSFSTTIFPNNDAHDL